MANCKYNYSHICSYVLGTKNVDWMKGDCGRSVPNRSEIFRTCQ